MAGDIQPLHIPARVKERFSVLLFRILKSTSSRKNSVRLMAEQDEYEEPSIKVSRTTKPSGFENVTMTFSVVIQVNLRV